MTTKQIRISEAAWRVLRREAFRLGVSMTVVVDRWAGVGTGGLVQTPSMTPSGGTGTVWKPVETETPRVVEPKPDLRYDDNDND